MSSRYFCMQCLVDFGNKRLYDKHFTRSGNCTSSGGDLLDEDKVRAYFGKTPVSPLKSIKPYELGLIDPGYDTDDAQQGEEDDGYVNDMEDFTNDNDDDMDDGPKERSDAASDESSTDQVFYHMGRDINIEEYKFADPTDDELDDGEESEVGSDDYGNIDSDSVADDENTTAAATDVDFHSSNVDSGHVDNNNDTDAADFDGMGMDDDVDDGGGHWADGGSVGATQNQCRSRKTLGEWKEIFGDQVDMRLMEKQEAAFRLGHQGTKFSVEQEIRIELAAKIDQAKAPLISFNSFLKWGKNLAPDMAQRISGSRKSLIGELKDRYGEKIDPVVVQVPLKARHNSAPHVQRVAEVTVNDTMDGIYQLLTEASLNQDENRMFGGNFPGDRPNFRPTRWDDLDTGSQYLLAWRTECKGNNVPTGVSEQLVPILLACDKAHVDKSGKLTIEGVCYCLGIFKRKIRELTEAWRIAGYMVNQSLEEYKSSPNKLSDYHDILEYLLRPFAELEQGPTLDGVSQGPGVAWVFDFMGKEYPCLLRFAVLLCIGDTPGLDLWICRSQCRRLEVNCICRYCDIPTMVCDDPYYEYEYTSQRIIQKMIDNQDHDNLTFESYKDVKHAFARLRFRLGGGQRGLHGATPQEVLHVFEIGTLLRSISEFYHIRRVYAKHRKQQKSGGKTRLYKAEDHIDILNSQGLFRTPFTETYERYAKLFGLSLQHQSDRDWPRSHFPQGVVPKASTKQKKGDKNAATTTGKKNAAEIQGVALIHILILTSTFGQEVISELISADVLANWIGNFELLVCLGEFFKKTDGFTIKDLKHGGAIILGLMH